MQVLVNLHLVRKKELTNAGAWLLSIDSHNVKSSAHISCALFQGVSKVQILDKKVFAKDLYSNFQEAIAYLQSKLNTESIITGTGQDNRLELPVDTLREALVNMITTKAQVIIKNDRVLTL